MYACMYIDNDSVAYTAGQMHESQQQQLSV